MTDFDLIVRNAHVITASDIFDCDIGISDGKIVQLGHALGTAAREIDAAGRTVTPGGVDAHCHLDQPMTPPTKTADDFDTGTRSAACGGTTTIISFAAQQKGQSLQAAVEDYRARAHGLNVFAETCPQYLFLTAEDLGIDDSYKGARCICSPPPRDKANQQVIWDALNDGLFTVFSSDHAPFKYDGIEGKKPNGQEVEFRHIPNGIPGLETRMALLWSEGVLAGRMTANRFVELTSTGPAKAYGLHPRKGTVAVGADADLVIRDERDFVLKNEMLHHEVDYTPYEGMRLKAWPGLTLSRGEVVWDGRDFHPQPGRGELLARGAPTLFPARR